MPTQTESSCPDRLLTTAEVSDILGVTEGTLMAWRSTSRYPLPFVKVGRLVKYRSQDIQEFIKQRLRTGTSLELDAHTEAREPREGDCHV